MPKTKGVPRPGVSFTSSSSRPSGDGKPKVAVQLARRLALVREDRMCTASSCWSQHILSSRYFMPVSINSVAPAVKWHKVVRTQRPVYKAQRAVLDNKSFPSESDGPTFSGSRLRTNINLPFPATREREEPSACDRLAMSRRPVMAAAKVFLCGK